MRKIGVGILGTGSIVRRIMADFSKGANYELVAVASRDIERALAFKREYGAEYAFGSYAGLKSCDEVELVYVASPNTYHCEHTLEMLNAGKHVLCEKPFAINDGEAARMTALAREKRLFLMEAMWSRFMPAMISAKELSNKLGALRLLTANFGYELKYDAASRIYDPALGGGALLDVGVYCLNLASGFLGARPLNARAASRKAPSGVDAGFAMQLEYETGACAQLYCASDTRTDSGARLYFERGILDIPDFWHATEYTLTSGGNTDTRKFAAENEGHYHEFEHAAKLILEGRAESPIMPLDETRDILALMTALRRAEGIYYPTERGYA